MKRLLYLTLIICSLSVGSHAQRRWPPHFADYPVKERVRGKPAPINFRSHSQARMFRTMLRDTAALGANFAGHYAVNWWGCGTECMRIGIVNLKTGDVYMSPFAAQVGIDSRVGSRLLVVNPPARLKEEFGDGPLPAFYLQTRYYLWQNGKLVLIYPAELKGKLNDIFPEQ